MRRPRFIAEQSRHARGVLGRIIAFVMARETWRENLAAMDALDIQESDHVLDVGCGHGRSLAEIARRAPLGRSAGVDPSGLMVEIAVERNRALVKERRIDVAIADADAMPFPDQSFDKLLCVHVVYFWPSLIAACAELARVTRPGGRLAMVFRTSANEAAVRAFPADVYTFPALRDVNASLGDVGFVILPEESDWRHEARAPVRLIAARAGR